MNPSTSFLMGNLVDGITGNELSIDDPIIRYLVKNEGWKGRADSDCDSRDFDSEDSDIEVLIEEHILLEKLKKVTGNKPDGFDKSVNISDGQGEKSSTSSAVDPSCSSDLIPFKNNIEEAMQINLKMREELLAMEKKLVLKYKEACEKKQEKIKEMKTAESKLRFYTPCLADRFLDTFRSPYFKSDGAVAPWNSDFEKIMTTNLPLISSNDDWNTNDIASLCIAIKKGLMKELSIAKREGIYEKYSFLVNVNPSNIIHLKNSSLFELVKNMDDDSFDWKGIAASISKPVTEKDCKQMWFLHLKPSLRNWSEDERSKLMQIATKYNLQNWDQISKELNSERSGYECFLQYQDKNAEWCDGKWSKYEEGHLTNVVDQSKIGNYISWDKVNYFIDTKQIDQIYTKWHGFQAPHLRRGRFTELEDKILLGMIHKFGANLKSVASVLKNRSMAQLNARYKDHLLPQLCHKVGEWTCEEDEKLLALVRDHGEAKWAIIAKHLKTRSRIQIRHRYNLLKQKFANNPDLNLKLINRPKRTTSKKRTSRNRTFFNKIVSANVKQLLKNKNPKAVQKRSKTIDMKLTHYYQMKFLKEEIKEAEYENRFKKRSESSNPKTSSSNAGNSDGQLNIGKSSLLSSLIFSSVALRNLMEVAETDDWSQKDRTKFHKGIIELCISSEESLEDLLKWHNVFCSLLSAPAMLSKMNLEDWKDIIPKNEDIKTMKTTEE